jgi:hypothetical protein
MITHHQEQGHGQQQKAAAHALLEARREVFIRRGRRALLLTMLAGDGRATADDVQAAVELPPGIDPRCLGSVPGRLAYDRIIEPAGFIRSTRPETHSRWLQVWRLVDRQRAERWLADHPDLLDPGGDDGGCAVLQRGLFDLPLESTTPTRATAGAAP